MSGEKTGKCLNITFRNPNTVEETSKYLIKIIACNMAEHMVNKKAPDMALNDDGVCLPANHEV